MSQAKRIALASNLGFGFEERLRALPFVLSVAALPTEGHWTLPAEAEFLIYLHRPGNGGRDAPRPTGWPGRLRAVQCAAAGLDHYPDWLFEVDPVASARGTNSAAIAEYVLTAMLCHEKRVPTIWQDGSTPWPSQAETTQAPLGSLAGKTLGLLGFGSIAQQVARLALPFGMRILAFRRTPGALPEGVEQGELEDVLKQADVLVLALPLNEETRGIVSAPRLATMKASAHLINIARGALIDQFALEAALRAGRLAAATLDVTDPEPLPQGASLYRAPGVRISAHVSWSSAATLGNIASKVAQNLARFAEQQPLLDVVDRTLRY